MGLHMANTSENEHHGLLMVMAFGEEYSDSSCNDRRVTHRKLNILGSVTGR